MMSRDAEIDERNESKKAQEMIVRGREGVLPVSIDGVEGDLAGSEGRWWWWWTSGGGGEAPTEIALARRTLALLACFLPPCHHLHIVQELECFGILILYLRF